MSQVLHGTIIATHTKAGSQCIFLTPNHGSATNQAIQGGYTWVGPTRSGSTHIPNLGTISVPYLSDMAQLIQYGMTNLGFVG